MTRSNVRQLNGDPSTASERDPSARSAETTIRSVVKAARLLQYFASEDVQRTAKAAADSLGLPLPTTLHLLSTLTAEGLLTKDADRRYDLGPAVAGLSMAYLKRSGASHLLGPLRELANATGDTVYLSGWRGSQLRVLATLEGSNVVKVSPSPVILSGHAHARASGKVLLAALSPAELDNYLATHELIAITRATITSEKRLRAELLRVRSNGYALDEEEIVPGVCCVAAPVIDHSGIIACLTVASPAHRFHQDREELIATVVDVASRAGSHLSDAIALSDGMTLYRDSNGTT
jgi:IclR family acetate operon transcriptional repressor